MVLRRRAFQIAVEHLPQRLRSLDRLEQVGGDALQRDVHEHPERQARGENVLAERTEAEAHGGQQLRVLVLADRQQLSGAGHERHRDDLRGEPAERTPGAVRSRGGRTRDGLPVDVSHVLEGQAVRAQQPRQLVEVRARGEAHPAALEINVEDAADVLEIEKHTRGDRDAGEAVPRTHRLDPHPLLRRRGDSALHGLGIAWPFDALRPDGLASAPVAPDRTGRRHRKTFPSPR